MAVSTFKGVIPVEDWSQTTQSVLNSFNRADDIRREERRYQEAQQQKREADFMKLAEVHPETMLSQQMQKKQADNIQQFIEMAGNEYRKYNYKPTLNSKLKIQQAKDALVGWQQNMLVSQDKWKQAYGVIQKDKFKGDYDEGQFWDKTQDFYKSGELPEDLLTPKSYGNLADYFLRQKVSGEKQEWINTTDKNGTTTSKQITRRATDDERKQQMKGDFFDNIRLNKTAIEEFSKLPPDEKNKYLDAVPEDKRGEAVTNYLWDKYQQYYGAPSEKTTVKPTASPFKFASQNKVQATPSSAEDEIPINIGKYTAKPFEPRKDDKGNVIIDPKTGKPEDANASWNKTKAGKNQMGYVKSEGDVYSFAPGTVGTLHLSQKYNKNTGKLEKTKVGHSDLQISNVLIKYYPVLPKGDMVFYRTEDGKPDKHYLDASGKVKDGYRLQAIVEDKNGDRFPLTDETKGLLKTKFPNNVSNIKTSNGGSVNIDDIPLTIDQGEQDPDYKETPTKSNKSTPKKDPLKLF
jgi:hypothetical protein